MQTFIRVVEVWQPSADGTVLELASGLFDAAPRFGAASRGLCFGRAEGLPGRAWHEGRPLLLRRLAGSYFQRVAAAGAEGLNCALALPLFDGDRLTSVVVMLCGAGGSEVGAIELWHNDPRITGDLTLEDGSFGAGADQLEALSRDTYLPRGAGLPGLAWQRGASIFIDELGGSRHFLRAQAAASAGIVRGLALPCGRAGDAQTWVLSLLSSARYPVARRVESWLPAETPGLLQRGFGHEEEVGPLATGPQTALAPAALGIVGAAWADATARVSSAPQRLGAPLEASLQQAGLRSTLVLPLPGDSGVGEVIALHF